MKSQKAITLISLVITIIILIILAGIVIILSLENNGIFIRAKQAKELINKQEATDIINLKITTAQMNKYAEEQRMPTLKELSLALGEDNEIKYVTQASRVASTETEYDVPSENPSSIYTRLKKYPYEFEINGQLQLASIDGVKLSASNEPQSNMKVLWENPSPKEGFAEQTITWGGETPSLGTKKGAEEYEYNYLMIEYYATDQYNGDYSKSTIATKGENILLEGQYRPASNDCQYVYYRKVEYINDVTLKFDKDIISQMGR